MRGEVCQCQSQEIWLPRTNQVQVLVTPPKHDVRLLPGGHKGVHLQPVGRRQRRGVPLPSHHRQVVPTKHVTILRRELEQPLLQQLSGVPRTAVRRALLLRVQLDPHWSEVAERIPLSVVDHAADLGHAVPGMASILVGIPHQRVLVGHRWWSVGGGGRSWRRRGCRRRLSRRARWRARRRCRTRRWRARGGRRWRPCAVGDDQLLAHVNERGVGQVVGDGQGPHRGAILEGDLGQRVARLDPVDARVSGRGGRSCA